MLETIKSIKKESIVVYTIGIFLFIISGLFFQINGYPLVVTATTTLDLVVPPIYMLPVFLLYGILIGELIWMISEKVNLQMSVIFSIEVIIVGVFSFIRYIVSIPFSGHAIILSFYLFHQIISKDHKYYLRILLGIIFLIITIVFKIFLWNDPMTFLLGLVLGVISWIPGFIYKKLRMKDERI